MSILPGRRGDDSAFTSGGRGLTARSVIIGLICVAGAAFVTPYSDLLIRGSWMACSHLPMLPLLVFAGFILIVNTFLRATAPQWVFSQAELFVIYIMMLVSALLPSFGVTAYLIPTITGSNYFAVPDNKWVETFYQYIRPWMVPFDPTQGHSQILMKEFYEGIPAGQPIPWHIWVKPLAAWTAFGFGLFFIWMCLSTILRKQWVDNEKLSFPLVQLPVEMARQDDKYCWAGNSFFRNRMMWIGCAIPVIIHGINGLHVYYPSVPELVINLPLNQYFTTWPYNQMGPFMLFTHFSVIGFTFLISSELGFSLWFFYIVFKALEVITVSYGMEHRMMPNYHVLEFEAHQMLGAFLVFFGYMIYLSRRQIVDVVRKAITNAKDVDDRNETLSYRTAFFGLIIGTLFLAGWLCMARGSASMFPMAVAALLLFYLIAISLSRFVAEGGLLFVQAPFRPTDLMGSVMGMGAIGPANLTTLSFVERIFMFDLRGFLMPSLLDSMKISDSARINRRKLLVPMIMAIVVAVVVSYITVIWIGYRKGGGINLSQWFFVGSPQGNFNVLRDQITIPAERDWSGATFTVIGATVTLLLAYLRMMFAWWPLHPIGYAMGPSWPMIQLWFSIMIGWSLKSMILRYGGMKAFLRARPACLGLVLGEFASVGFWLALDAMSGIKDHRIFLN